MGREIKRVPAGFDWPMKVVWWGFVIPGGVECGTCEGTGTVSYRTADYQVPDEDGRFYCHSCEGEKRAFVEVPVPEGGHYQAWETTSGGSPISPAFATPEELARWLADTGASSFGRDTATYEEWLSFARGPGWAPSMVMQGGVVESGVAHMAKTNEAVAL